MEEIIKDAMRYRWLRDTNNMRETYAEDGESLIVGYVEPVMFVDSEWTATGETGLKFDRLIDQAMLFQRLRPL
jgi:hypothetical protein